MNDMIKIMRTPCPKELTDDVKDEFTKEYVETKKNVWNREYIKKALFEMSNGKCVFCECKLGEESKYMEVEHFHPKKDYPFEVIDWNNLLPICKRCNVNKGDVDTKNEPIINPTIDDPKKHLHILNYRYIGRDRLGKDTIDLLCLNDLDKLLVPRVQVGNQVVTTLEQLHSDLKKLGCLEKASSMDSQRIVNRMRNLLKSCLPDKVYSTTCSYVLFSGKYYYEIKDIIKSANKWDASIELLEKEVLEHCLVDNYSLQIAVSG